MVAVKGLTIDSGPIDETSDSLNTPPEKWPDLLAWRKDFIRGKFSYDCRKIVAWMKDANRMWQPMGYASIDALVREALGVDPVDVSLVVAWLEKYRPDQPVSLPEALTRAQQDAMRAEPAPLRKPGPGRGHKTPDNYQMFEYGTSSPYLAARLARDNPDILEDVKQGKYRSMRAAAMAAGIVKDKPRIAVDGEDMNKAAALLAKRLTPAQIGALVRALIEYLDLEDFDDAG